MKMPKRTKEIELDGNYAGFKFQANLSVPVYVFSYIQTGNWDLIQSALKEILISWNFTDQDGQPLPQPTEIIDARDPFGKPVKTQQLDDEGIPILDKDNNPVMGAMKIPAIALIPMDLMMAIVTKVSESVGDISPS